MEEEKCVRRFVCEVATGHLEAPEYQPAIQALLQANLENEVKTFSIRHIVDHILKLFIVSIKMASNITND